MKYFEALKKYNEGKPTWCFPRKGTVDYKAIIAIMKNASVVPVANAKKSLHKSTKSTKSTKSADVPASAPAPVAETAPVVSPAASTPTAAKTPKAAKAAKAAKSPKAAKATSSAKVTKAPSAKAAKTKAAKTPKTPKASGAAKSKKSKKSLKSTESAPELVGGAPATDGSVPADEVSESESNRYFRCVYNGNTYGRICGKKPKQAANKCFTSLLKHLKKSGTVYAGEKLSFSIVECTRSSKHCEYLYVGERTQLAAPVEVSIQVKNKTGDMDNKVVTYRHKNIVRKVKKTA